MSARFNTQPDMTNESRRMPPSLRQYLRRALGDADNVTSLIRLAHLSTSTTTCAGTPIADRLDTPNEPPAHTNEASLDVIGTPGSDFSPTSQGPYSRARPLGGLRVLELVPVPSECHCLPS